MIGCGGSRAAAPAGAVVKPAVAATEAPAIDSEFMAELARTYGFKLGRPTAVTITPDGKKALFLRAVTAESFEMALYELDLADGRERLLVNADMLLGSASERISDAEAARRERQRQAMTGVVSYQLSDDGTRLLVGLAGRLFIIDRVTTNVSELPRDGGDALDPRFSPDGKHVAMVRDGDLYVSEVEKLRSRRLTSRPNADISFGVAEFVAQEEFDRSRGYWWSPRSDALLFQRTDESMVQRAYLADPLNPESEPRLRRYPRPGGENAEVRLGILDIASGKTRWVEWDRATFPYLIDATWSKAAPPTILVANRKQSEMALLAINTQSGATRELIREADKDFVNTNRAYVEWIADGSGFLWSTERGGRYQLELRDPQGALVRELTPLDLGLQSVVGIPDGGEHVYVIASADPTESHVFRVALATGVVERLTEERGEHQVEIGRAPHAYALFSQPLSGPPQVTVVREDGSRVPIRSIAKVPPIAVNLELTTVAISAGEVHAAIVRPRDFDSKKRYPVLNAVYAGPGVRVVVANERAYLDEQWYADQGFIVVSIDGRGTPNRGRDWERAIARDLISVPLADQSEAILALAERFPEMDRNRVGISGWSFGGYTSAMALLLRPDVFHVGIAGAPVTDWRYYDTAYTERYMGLPADNPEGYTTTSALTYADRLERPLLIIHGSVDDNVYLMNSLALSNALFRAGKPHELLVIPGLTHMVADPLVRARLHERIAMFLRMHLGTPKVVERTSGNALR